MKWRHLCLVRAGLAAGLLSGLTLLWVRPATAQSGTQPKSEGEPFDGFSRGPDRHCRRSRCQKGGRFDRRRARPRPGQGSPVHQEHLQAPLERRAPSRAHRGEHRFSGTARAAAAESRASGWGRSATSRGPSAPLSEARPPAACGRLESPTSPRPIQSPSRPVNWWNSTSPAFASITACQRQRCATCSD